MTQAVFPLPTMLFTCLIPSSPISAATVQPVYVPLEIELSSPAIPALGDVNHAGSVLRPVASVSKVGGAWWEGRPGAWLGCDWLHASREPDLEDP